jgi:hypothetical protein
MLTSKSSAAAQQRWTWSPRNSSSCRYGGDVADFLQFATFLMASSLLCACTDQARVYPLDPAAMQAGVPKIEFVRRGLGHGPVTVTMPDGEILQGEYQVTENAAVGLGIAGAHTATAVAFGSGRPVVISATGNRGTIFSTARARRILEGTDREFAKTVGVTNTE